MKTLAVVSGNVCECVCVSVCQRDPVATPLYTGDVGFFVNGAAKTFVTERSKFPYGL